jgi:predicted NBD/HSP70 family sugar kinase
MTRRSSQSALREANNLRVLDALRRGPATQAELARTTALSGATVSTIVRELLVTGVLEQVERPGRGKLVQLSARSGLAAGIAFEDGRISLALGDLTSTVRAEQDVPLPSSADTTSAVAAAVDALGALLAAEGVDAGALVGVGVALAAPVRAAGRAAGSAWVGLDVGEELRARLDCPVHVDNDANLGARAEARWGQLGHCTVGAWVKAAHGVGVGLLLDGQVHRGVKGLAGELGHVSDAPDGSLCDCGNRGCLELSAGTPALVREYAATTGIALSARELISRAVAGDAAARRLVDDAGTRIGHALAGLVTLLDPERIVLAGDLAAAGDLLVDPLVTALRRRAMPAVADNVAVTVSELGARAEVLGALALALDHAQPQLHPQGAS